MQKSILVTTGLTLFLLPAVTFAQEKPRGETRIYNTVKINSQTPRIDGVLDDACWSEGEWSGNYRQQMPEEGAKPSQQTKIKILYDGENMYVAFKCYDDANITDRQMARRDEFAGDIVGINFDSYHDHRTGFEFNLTAAGSKIDLILVNKKNEMGINWDVNWNPVWDGKTGKMDSGWVAEMRIPLSQLRYSNKSVQVWGMHSWRWINKNKEEDQWNLIPRDNAGALYYFGELHGLENLPNVRRVEFMPYTLAKVRTYEAEPGNPFADGTDPSITFGLDGKVGIGSNFTVDYTINPDFGQVEADPSELNLTAFETYYEEKRPFFIEGKNIMDFEFDDNQLLYSRRIGHAPVYRPEVPDGEYVKMPENTNILGALKLTGKTEKGLSLGILESLTSPEYARVSSPGNDYKIVAEPLTNYFSGRVQKDINNSNTLIGGMINYLYRDLNHEYLSFLSKSAVTGGLDFKHFIKDKTYFIDFKAMGSLIDGSTESITLLQQESSRYFQRPNAPHLKVDTTATRLQGTGGSLEIGKGSNGHWRYTAGLHWVSPGLELNDMGFQPNADMILGGATLGYEENKPHGIFRQYAINLSEVNFWNFGGQYLASEVGLEGSFTFENKWDFHANIEREGKQLDATLLRGGPGVYKYGSFSQDYYLMTDQAKKVTLSLGYESELKDDGISKRNEFQSDINWKVTNSFQVTPQFSYNKITDDYQYIYNPELEQQGRYLLGRLNRQIYGITLRMSYSITPDLTLQYYGSPYVTMGNYSNFKSLSNAENENPGKVFKTYSADQVSYTGRTYTLNDGVNPAVDFDNPDFNFREFRSNFVARWEYRRGSVIYLVWTHNRTSDEAVTNSQFDYNMKQLFRTSAQNVFLIKFNYWFSL
ncbi:MAG TPA: DUF5916 domain-containing protein [Bacteroidales bacterium]|nr:DUF5916 domain-containing protein [Bacteroidales bacterium]